MCDGCIIEHIQGNNAKQRERYYIMKIGDKVKSLDFVHIDSMYVIGTVKEINHKQCTITIDVTECSMGKRVGEEVVTMMQGHMMLDELGTRLTVIK